MLVKLFKYTKYYEERALYSNSNLRELPQKSIVPYIF